MLMTETYQRDLTRLSSAEGGFVPELTSRHKTRETTRMAQLNMETVKRVLQERTAEGETESPQSLSLRAGLNRDAVRDILRGRSKNPSAATLQALANALGGDLTLFSSGEGSPASVQLSPSARPAPMPTIPPGQWTRDVPVVGGGLAAPLHIVQAGAALDIEQTSLDFGTDPDYAPRPPIFATNRQIYCVYVWGDSMVPRFDAGDRLYVDPRRPPSVGDDVVVQLAGDCEMQDGQVVVALIKRLARRNGSTIELEQYNPATKITVEMSRIAAIHRVVPWRELL